MAGVAVVTDSTSCLGREGALDAGVTVVPLQVVIDDVSRSEGVDDATAAVVAQALRAGRPVTTSRPSPETFAAAFAELAGRGFDAVVSVHLSRTLSGTYQAAAQAAESSAVPVTVVDSGTLAMATGFAVLAGARLAADGAGADQVAGLVQRRAAAASTYFSVDSLEHLRRGGRIGSASALLGSVLSVKPLLTVADGLIQPYERVRTASRARARLEELAVLAMSRAAAAGDQVDVAVLHLDDQLTARGMAERLRVRMPAGGEVGICEVGAVVGAHAGPGTLGVVVAPRV